MVFAHEFAQHEPGGDHGQWRHHAQNAQARRTCEEEGSSRAPDQGTQGCAQVAQGAWRRADAAARARRAQRSASEKPAQRPRGVSAEVWHVHHRPQRQLDLPQLPERQVLREGNEVLPLRRHAPRPAQAARPHPRLTTKGEEEPSRELSPRGFTCL